MSFGLHSQLSLLFLVINATEASAVFTFVNLVLCQQVWLPFLFFFFPKFSFGQNCFISSLAAKLNQNFLPVSLINTYCIKNKKQSSMNDQSKDNQKSAFLKHIMSLLQIFGIYYPCKEFFNASMPQLKKGIWISANKNMVKVNA